MFEAVATVYTVCRLLGNIYCMLTKVRHNVASAPAVTGSVFVRNLDFLGGQCSERGINQKCCPTANIILIIHAIGLKI